jgi:beta-lactamase class A
VTSILQNLFPRRRLTVAAVLSLGLHGVGTAQTSTPSPWATRLVGSLSQIDANHSARIGVYVRDLDTGEAVSHKSSQRWYLASMVKVPVAIAVLRGVERGDFTLDTPVTLRASDYVDGAGSTNRKPVGASVRIRALLEQMILYSDNTASDMLIDLVGIAEVNAVVESLVPGKFGRITSLSDVRRAIYGQLTPRAERIEGRDWLMLRRQANDAERLRLLSHLTGTPVAEFRLPSIDAAYAAYYASGLNAAPLEAYGELLEALVEGRALRPTYTGYLLAMMERVVTGKRRIQMGLPKDVRFAQKTGTQRGRICDGGLIRTQSASSTPRRILVVACTRDEPSLERSEIALAQVGAAICRSGLLNEGVTDASSCPALPGADRLPAVPAER